MLRATTNTLVRATTSWSNPAMYSSLKFYSTPANEEPLSKRLGGTGRGKITDSADPFSSFLNNARKNNRGPRNGNFTPRQRKPAAESKGQFDDAEEPKQQKQQQARRDRKEKQSTAAPSDSNNNNNNRRSPRNNDRNNNNNKRENNRQQGNNKFNSARRSAAPQEVRTRRATTFIDKDIDWASFDTTTTPLVDTNSTEQTADDNELVLKDMQGDYDRYLSVGGDLKWSDIVKGDTMSNLVGSNPTLDLHQKTAFLNAVSKATTIAARK